MLVVSSEDFLEIHRSQALPLLNLICIVIVLYPCEIPIGHNAGMAGRVQILRGNARIRKSVR